MTKTDQKFFQKARQIASISDFKKIHVGCVAVYKGNIIGIGCNTNKTHPMQKYYNRYCVVNDSYEYNDTLLPKLHAEMNCLNSIRHFDIKFSKVKLYIFRSRTTKVYGMARPCPSCMAAIKDMGIRNVYYTTNDGFAYESVGVS